MPWPKAHKKETRERVLDAAAAAFRERGVDDVSVGEIMDRAGLTHGGFYAHFKSKDELVAEALSGAGSEMRERLWDSKSLLALVNMYLSTVHFADRAHGCAIAALGPELSRGSARLRRTLGGVIHKRLERLSSLVTARSREKRERQAIGTLACMVGGMILARGLGGERGEEILAECRAFLRDALESPERSTTD
ncbi:MAG TPA: TetR/AcrR family transcriptional regulator [Candidatus Baltobacteraceae bacterium]|jgi:TetR/AcrR family transcriptional repressor of nem operon